MAQRTPILNKQTLPPLQPDRLAWEEQQAALSAVRDKLPFTKTWPKQTTSKEKKQ